MKIKQRIMAIIAAITIGATSIISFAPAAHAENLFSVSPMNQKIVLTPGETYRGSFKLTNPASSDSNFDYQAKVTPFFVSENYVKNGRVNDKFILRG